MPSLGRATDSPRARASIRSRSVGWSGEVEALADPIGVDRDDSSVGADQRPAGRPRCERSRVLHAAADLRAAGPSERSLDSRHEPDGDPRRAATGRREPEHDIADGELVVRPGERLCAARVHVDHGKVAVAIDALDGAAGRPAVTEGDRDLVAAQVVGIREDAAVADHDAGAANAAADADDAACGAIVNGAER
jgi:hypothetical protein